MIEKVKKGSAIRASYFNGVVDVINDLSARSLYEHGSFSNGIWRKSNEFCTITNSTAENLSVGNLLKITGMGAGGLSAFLQSGFRLNGVAATGTPEETLAILTESIPAGKVGRCIVPGIVPGIVTLSDSEDKFAVGNGNVFTSLSSSAGANYRIVGLADSSGTTFGFLVPNIGGSGHLIGTISEGTGSSYTVAVGNKTYAATSPLATDIAIGTAVAISGNRATGGWEIIAAECS